MNNSQKEHLAGQVRQLRARFVQSVGSALGDVLPAKSLKQWIREECGNYRQRIYGPLQTLALFIEQVLNTDHSCQDAVARGMSGRASLNQTPCSLNTAGDCKARARLPLVLIERMVRETGELLCAQQPKEWLWRGREVKLVDGATVSMPDTEANQASFPQNRSQKAGLGFPLARLVPETLVMREVRVGGWTLVTTLTNAQEVSKRDLYDLYHLRWQIELDLRSIKAVMQMDVLRCMTPEMVAKEIAVHLLAYNSISS